MDPQLARVSKLLAKAERTEFEAEAVALLEKCSELLAGMVAIGGGDRAPADPRAPDDAQVLAEDRWLQRRAAAWYQDVASVGVATASRRRHHRRCSHRSVHLDEAA